LSDLVDFVNIELQKVSVWFKANKLAINAKKTKYMIFRTKNCTVNLTRKDIYINFNDPGAQERPELKINLTRVHNNAEKGNQTYKMLGVIFDEYLSFNQHVRSMQTKLAKSIFILNRSKNFITRKARRMLYFSLVHSHLSYCPIIYSIASKSCLKNLLVYQKKKL
jgi:predicted transcriptional regulator